MPGFGLVDVRIRGYRSLLDVTFRPGALTALVGEARAGKSNTLAAIRTLLDPGAPPIAREDVAVGGDGHVRIRGRLADGTSVWVTGGRSASRARRSGVPPVLFLPAARRSGSVLADGGGLTDGPGRALAEAIRDLAAPFDPTTEGGSDAAPAGALVSWIDACCEARAEGTVIMIEEPELFLRPHAQRYLCRQLRALASMGNQVIYSTHSPAFLNVTRLEEFALVQRAPGTGTTILQPRPLPQDEGFRAMSEFDAERSELFLAGAAVLVEGRTEKLVLPFVFHALGYDPDREAISIVECGGKANIPLFVGICRAVDVPHVAVHDRDAPRGERPSDAETRLNTLIREAAGASRTVVLEPDLEGVAGLRGHARKPERAWRRFRSLRAPQVPPALARVVELAVSLARGAEPAP